MPKKSVMDSKSAKWLSSVDCCCSVVLLLWVIVVVVVLTGLAVSPLNRKLAVSGSITDLVVVCPTTLGVGAAAVGLLLLAAASAEAEVWSKKFVTTSGSEFICKMTSGGFWGWRGWGCCCWWGDCTRATPPPAGEGLTRIEVKSAVPDATLGRTWAEILKRKSIITGEYLGT